MAGFLVELDDAENSRFHDALAIQGGQRITIMRELIRAYAETVEREGALSLPLLVTSSPKGKIGEKPKTRYGAKSRKRG